MIRTVFTLAIAFALAGAAHAQQFRLASPDIKPNGTIPEEQVYSGFGCSGKNISPALAWSGAPKDAKSFALLVHDPDAGGAGWWHWVVVDIPAGAAELAGNMVNANSMARATLTGRYGRKKQRRARTRLAKIST